MTLQPPKPKTENEPEQTRDRGIPVDALVKGAFVRNSSGELFYVTGRGPEHTNLSSLDGCRWWAIPNGQRMTIFGNGIYEYGRK